jgi:hypothetical protein
MFVFAVCFFSASKTTSPIGSHSMMKGGEGMKKLIVIAMVAMLALSMGACAGKMKKEPTKVKCPACGYEFDLVQ